MKSFRSSRGEAFFTFPTEALRPLGFSPRDHLMACSNPRACSRSRPCPEGPQCSSHHTIPQQRSSSPPPPPPCSRSRRRHRTVTPPALPRARDSSKRSVPRECGSATSIRSRTRAHSHLQLDPCGVGWRRPGLRGGQAEEEGKAEGDRRRKEQSVAARERGRERERLVSRSFKEGVE